MVSRAPAIALLAAALLAATAVGASADTLVTAAPGARNRGPGLRRPLAERLELARLRGQARSHLAREDARAVGGRVHLGRQLRQ